MRISFFLVTFLSCSFQLLELLPAEQQAAFFASLAVPVDANGFMLALAIWFWEFKNPGKRVDIVD